MSVIYGTTSQRQYVHFVEYSRNVARNVLQVGVLSPVGNLPIHLVTLDHPRMEVNHSTTDSQTTRGEGGFREIQLVILFQLS